MKKLLAILVGVALVAFCSAAYAATILPDDVLGELYAGAREDNEILLENSAQEDLDVESNINAADSASLVQINTVDSVGDTFNENNTDLGGVTNSDMRHVYYEGYNTLTLQNDAQKDLHALSNLNAVDSASAVQTNIVHNSPADLDAISNINKATVGNQDADHGEFIKDNTLEMYNNAQKNLRALSNLNAVDSATAIQTNIVHTHGANAETEITNENDATVSNDSSLEERTDGKTTNSLCLENKAQKNLGALSNANVVDSATAVQTNIVHNCQATGHTTDNINTATVSNESDKVEGDFASWIDLKLDNALTLLGNAQKDLHALSNLNAVDSATAVQTNIATSRGSSGTWGTCTTTNENTATVSNDDNDVYKVDIKQNRLTLSSNAQQNLKALSNVNAVSSATAVQTNMVTNVNTGGPFSGTTTNTNSATVTNTNVSNGTI